MKLSEPRAHCPRCRSEDVHAVSQDVRQCLDCGFVFHAEEALVGVDLIA